MIDVYRDFSESYLATSPVVGRKPAHERFAGALETYTIEPMMQDLKSLQAGTSHFLGQNFGKAFDVQFTNENNELEYFFVRQNFFDRNDILPMLLQKKQMTRLRK